MSSSDADSARVVGRKPMPRVLLIGLEPDLAADLAAIMPTTLVLDLASDAFRLRLAEWDAAVIAGDQASHYIAGHMNVVAFGGPRFGEVVSSSSRTVELQAHPRSNASEFVIPDHLPPDVEALVKRDLLPAATRNASKQTPNLVLASSEVFAVYKISPFLADGDHQVLAGRFIRPGGGETWAVPSSADPKGWVIAAFRHWATTNPSMRLRTEDWIREREWSSPAEDDMIDLISAAQAELKSQTDRLNEQIAEAESALLAATTEASAGPRRLLTAQGNALVEAVIDVLEGLGLRCEVVDDNAAKGAKLEDLRVTDPADPGWLALVEVRGYSKGAALYDLMRMERFVSNYAASTGSRPPSVWYVVNSFIGLPPDSRDLPLAGHPVELAEFADDGGVVVDTRELFRAWKAVQTGSRSADDLRADLKRPGRFSAAPPPSTPSDESP